MTVVANWNDLVAAVAAFDDDIRISGVITAPTPGQALVISEPDEIADQDGMRRITGGVLRNCVIKLNGFRRFKLAELEIYNPYGNGIEADNGIDLILEDNYDCVSGDALVLNTAAGGADTVASVHGARLRHTAQPGNTTGWAQRIGPSTKGFEFCDFYNVSTEGFYGGVRVGGAGNCVNMKFMNYWIDRAIQYGFLFNPTGDAHVRNVEIHNPVMNQIPQPIVANITDTTAGKIDPLVLYNGLFLGCGSQIICKQGPSEQAVSERIATGSVGAQVIRPAEPG